jgi:23S rRNA A1618 N6-methylase RlmF
MSRRRSVPLWQVLFQIGDLCEEQGNLRTAAKWFSVLVARISTDPGVLSRLGQVGAILIAV